MSDPDDAGRPDREPLWKRARAGGLGRLVGLASLAAVLALGAARPPVLEDLRLWAFDSFQNTKPRVPVGQPVVIVDIDEDSLTEHGQWPWPRSLMARLVDGIAAQRPLAIGFDLLFPEPDRSSPERIANELRGKGVDPALREALLAFPSNDSRLAESLSQAPSVLGMGIQPEGVGDPAAGGAATPVRTQGTTDPLTLLPAFDAPLASLPVLTQASRGQGVLTVLPGRDSIVRQVPMVFQVGGRLQPGFSLEVLRVALGAPWYTVFAEDERLRGVAVGQLAIPTADDGTVTLHFSPHLPRRFVSAREILDGTLPPGTLERKLVLVGFTGLGLVDFPATPIDTRVPGVEVHAQLLESIAENALLSRPPWAGWAELGAVALLGLLIIAVVPLFRPSLTALVLGFVLLTVIAACWLAFSEFRLLLDPAGPVAGTVAVYGVMLGFTLAEVDRKRRALQRDLEDQRAAAERLAGELNAARRIQMSLLPSDFPAFPEVPAIDLHARTEPAKAVGGDLYDFYPLPDGRVLFLVGDVAGKGMPAALFMALTKALCRSSALRGHDSLEAIVNHANAEIARENEAMLFVTLFMGAMDPRSGALEFINAGHEAPFLRHPDGTVTRVPHKSGPPLCVVDDFEYMAGDLTLEPGALLLVIGDGVSEAQVPEGELFGTERVETYLADCPADAASSAVVDGLFAKVADHMADAEPFDDITVLAIRRAG